MRDLCGESKCLDVIRRTVAYSEWLPRLESQWSMAVSAKQSGDMVGCQAALREVCQAWSELIAQFRRHRLHTTRPDVIVGVEADLWMTVSKRYLDWAIAHCTDPETIPVMYAAVKSAEFTAEINTKCNSIHGIVDPHTRRLIRDYLRTPRRMGSVGQHTPEVIATVIRGFEEKIVEFRATHKIAEKIRMVVEEKLQSVSGVERLARETGWQIGEVSTRDLTEQTSAWRKELSSATATAWVMVELIAELNWRIDQLSGMVV